MKDSVEKYLSNSVPSRHLHQSFSFPCILMSDQQMVSPSDEVSLSSFGLRPLILVPSQPTTLPPRTPSPLHFLTQHPLCATTLCSQLEQTEPPLHYCLTGSGLNTNYTFKTKSQFKDRVINLTNDS